MRRRPLARLGALTDAPCPSDRRIKASLELDDNARQAALDKAAQALEKYFFLIAFAAFIEDSDGLQGRFSGWLKARSEIWKCVARPAGLLPRRAWR